MVGVHDCCCATAHIVCLVCVAWVLILVVVDVDSFCHCMMFSVFRYERGEEVVPCVLIVLGCVLIKGV